MLILQVRVQKIWQNEMTNVYSCKLGFVIFEFLTDFIFELVLADSQNLIHYAHTS